MPATRTRTGRFAALQSQPVVSHTADVDSDAGSDVGYPGSPISNGYHPLANGTMHSTNSYPGIPLPRLGPQIKELSIQPSNSHLQLATYAPDQHHRASLDRAAVNTAAKYRHDLLTARMGNNAMDRYKSLSRLINNLGREMHSSGPDQRLKPSSWEPAQHMDLMMRIIEVGESLAIFGSADFNERSNATRAIMMKDYAYLLKLYARFFWEMLKDDNFVYGLPQAIQDELLSVRGLLVTRAESNSILLDQLIKHVGLEAQGGGGAVVYNTSMVSANPITNVQHKAITTVQTCASAAAKALQKSSNRYAAAALGGLAALFLVKRTGMLGFIPGMGRPSRRARIVTDDEESERGISRRRQRGRQGRNRLSADDRLLLAFDHVDKQFKELNKAQHNMELLRNDWRLGQVRLVAPFGGIDPPGVEQLDMAACEPRNFMHAQLGY